jgi:hypothetical protein
VEDARGAAGRTGPERDPALDELREAYEAGQLIVFAGAGVERHLDDKLADEPEVAKAIAALAPKLRAVLTTNLDHLLEKAFSGRWPTLSKATGDIATRREYILKLHGTLLDRAGWVLTREQYDRAMYADPKLKAAFTALFHTCPILFVGYGLADDDFDALLGHVRALAGEQPPRHFALVPADEVTPYRRRKLEAAGIFLGCGGGVLSRRGVPDARRRRREEPRDRGLRDKPQPEDNAAEPLERGRSARGGHAHPRSRCRSGGDPGCARYDEQRRSAR